MAEELSVKVKQVQNELLTRIRDGRLKSGTRLPSERQLADQLGVSHLTVRKGLEVLVARGVIVKQARVGNYVKQTTPLHALMQISVLIPNWMTEGVWRHPTASLLLAGINRVLDSREYLVNTISYHQGSFWEDVGQQLVERGADGVLFFVDNSVIRQDIQRLVDAGIKVVIISREPHLAGLDVVQVDIDLSMALAQLLDRLLEMGHRRIQIYQYIESPYRTKHFHIAEAILQRAGIKNIDDIVVNVPNHDGGVQFNTLPKAFDREPTAVIAPDEYIVSELFRLAHDRGWHVPRDLSIASIVDMTPHIHPLPVAAPDSVKLMRLMAEAAAEHMIKQLKGTDTSDRDIMLRCDVQWKDSIAPPRSS